MTDYRPYRFRKESDAGLDADFAAAASFEKIRIGKTALFWKSGFRWYAIPLDRVQRIFRRVEQVYGRLCCGGRNFVIEWLVLTLPENGELVLHIGDDVQKSAEALMEHLNRNHPHIPLGKEA